ncbi:MAG: response regulator [Lachnospiraceae bacterium]|nr:response regulator [Lachnospiraceae bacterium]
MNLGLTSVIEYEQMAALFDLILCALLVFDYADEREESNQFFTTLLYLVTIANAMEILAVILCSPKIVIPAFIKMIVMSCDYFLNAMLGFLFFRYTLAASGEQEHVSSILTSLNRILLSLEVILLISNFLLHNAFYFDENLKYCHGPFYLPVAFFFPSFYLIAATATYIRNYRRMGQRQSIAIFVMIALNVMGLVIQGYTKGRLLVALPFASLGVYVLYFALESPDYRNLRNTLEQLSEAKRKAEEASKSKDAFMTQISHEIRTPMNTIMGLTDMILEEMDGRDQLPSNTFPKVHQYVHNIANSGHQLIYIVDHMQSFKLTTEPLDGASYASAGDAPITDSAAVEVLAPDAHFLVVDDNEMNLFVAKNFLAKTGARVTTCTGGLECLRALTEEHYDMVFLDYMMPDMDGLDVIDRARKLVGNQNEHTPFVMVTANTVTGMETRAIEAGFVDYVSKPVNWEKFCTVISSHMPKNKITMHMVDGSYQIQTPRESAATMELFDTATGMEYCMNDADFYRETLNVFAEEYPVKSKEIQDYWKEKNYKLFTVRVHGLKSTARTIGAMELSNRAKALEDAGKELQEHEDDTKQLAFVEKHLPELLGIYEKTVAASNRLKL